MRLESEERVDRFDTNPRSLSVTLLTRLCCHTLLACKASVVIENDCSAFSVSFVDGFPTLVLCERFGGTPSQILRRHSRSTVIVFLDLP